MRFHHPAVPIVLSAALIDSIGFGIVLPVLPNLIIELAHVDLAEATRISGYLLVAYSVAQFFAGPILGNLGDRFGRRAVLLPAMAAFALDYGLMAMAPTIGWLFVGRLIAGVTGATYGPITAVLADVTPAEKRGAVFGMVGAAFGFGFILGPAIGGLLGGMGTRAPFIVAALLAAGNALWIALALPETLSREQRRPFDWRQAHVFGAFRPLLHAGGVAAPLLLAALLWQIAHNVYPSTWAFWAKLAMGWDTAAIGWSLAAAGIAMVVVQMFLTGPAIARFGEQRCVLFGLLVGVLGFLALVFAREAWMVYAIILLSGLEGVAGPALNALLSRMTDASHQGALQGGMASISSIASVIGPLSMTQALAFGAERGEPGGAFLLATLLTAAALLIVLFGVMRLRSRAPAAELE